MLSLRNLSSLQHPETTLAALRNTHWPTSLSWVDKHWDDLAMYLFLISFTPTPISLPTSLSPSLPPSHFTCDCVIYQTPKLSLAPSSPSLLSWVVKTWPPEVGGQKGACCLLWLLWLSVSSCVKAGQFSFSLGQSQTNTVVCTTRVMECLDGKQTTSLLKVCAHGQLVISVQRIFSICMFLYGEDEWEIMSQGGGWAQPSTSELSGVATAFLQLRASMK